MNLNPSLCAVLIVLLGVCISGLCPGCSSIFRKDIQLKGGNVTHDARLACIPAPKNMLKADSDFLAVKDAVSATATIHTQAWERQCSMLDQGSMGACVGFGNGGGAGTNSPWAEGNDRISNKYCVSIYYDAQRTDGQPGGEYPFAYPRYAGTTVEAGVGVMLRRGWAEKAAWATSFDEVALGISNLGPAICGLNWYAGMMTPDKDGYIHPTGAWQGGHCIEAVAIVVNNWERLDGYVVFAQSWGDGWGDKGYCRMTLKEFKQLYTGDLCTAAFLLNRVTSPSDRTVIQRIAERIHKNGL